MLSLDSSWVVRRDDNYEQENKYSFGFCKIRDGQGDGLDDSLRLMPSLDCSCADGHDDNHKPEHKFGFRKVRDGRGDGLDDNP